MPNILNRLMQQPEQPQANALMNVLGAGAGRGLISPPIQTGNIDLFKRPVVRNPDGSISTVRSMSVNFGGPEVLIPTVSDDGKLLNEREAIDLYLRTGRHLGMFANPESATAYAEALHNDQAKLYGAAR